MIVKHHFTTEAGERVSVYQFAGNYRYQVVTDNGIEYRELDDIFGLIGDSTTILEAAIKEQRILIPYGHPQLSAKCIRCSKHHGFPRRMFNHASICARCYDVMVNNYTGGNTWYQINPDGSKGSVIKEEE